MSPQAESLKLATAVLAGASLLALLYRPVRNQLPYGTRDLVAAVQSGVVIATIAVNRGIALTALTSVLTVATSIVYMNKATTYPFVQQLVLLPTCLALIAEAINIALGRAFKSKSSVRVSCLPMVLVFCLFLESVIRGTLNTACYPATIANVYFGAADLENDFNDAKAMIDRDGRTLARQFVPGPQRGIQLDSAVVLQPAATPRWIFYSGGNMEVMEASLKTVSIDAARLDANVILFNPRGVGQSTGRMAHVSDLIEDGAAVAAFYVRKYNIPTEKLMFIGHSIGGGVASGIAVRYYPNSPLVMDRTFSSLSDAAVGFSPVTAKMTKLVFSLFVGDLDTWSAYQQLSHKAKLVLYATRDEILRYDVCSLARLPEFQNAEGKYHRQAMQLPFTRPAGRPPHNIPWSLFATPDAIYFRIEQLWSGL